MISIMGTFLFAVMFRSLIFTICNDCIYIDYWCKRNHRKVVRIGKWPLIRSKYEEEYQLSDYGRPTSVLCIIYQLVAFFYVTVALTLMVILKEFMPLWNLTEIECLMIYILCDACFFIPLWIFSALLHNLSHPVEDIAVLAMLKQISPTDLSKPQELREQIIREFSTVPYIRKLKLRQVKKAIALYNQEKEDAAMSEQEAPAADPPQTTE